MSLIDLRNAIAEALAEEKAYLLPGVCKRLAITSEEDKDAAEGEAMRSKRSYVLRRLADKSEDFLIDLGYKLLKEYSGEYLREVLKVMTPAGIEILAATRRGLLDEIIFLDSQISIPGKLDLVTFLKHIWPLDEMPSTDSRFSTAAGDIRQHMINNWDWDYYYLFETYLGFMKMPDGQLFIFLERLVHPVIRDPEPQKQLVDLINKYLIKNSLILEVSGEISGYAVYTVRGISASGVREEVKNLIFAANGPKPELVLDDSISNNIRIVENEQYCLVYDLPIPDTGLLWSDLVAWWAKRIGADADKETGRNLYSRLYDSLQPGPEKFLFHRYFQQFLPELGEKLPALIPQVYLHYDPKTIRELAGSRRLLRQRMDFLILFSNHARVVIEIDGKQHYADGDSETAIASPRKYAELVSEDRRLQLAGYEIYRFGGYEFKNEEEVLNLTEEFFRQLFRKHNILRSSV